MHSSRRHSRRRERTAAACCYFATRRVGNPLRNHLGRVLSSSRACLRHEANSLPQPHAATVLPSPPPFTLLQRQRRLFPFRIAVSVPPAISPYPSLDGRTKPPVHHRRRCPTTGFPATDTPLEPLTLRRAPSRARYQPAAIPTATTESRDRPRVVGSPPVSHPTRRHATPRRAQRVFLCIAFLKPASVRSLITRVPRTVNHRRGAISRGFERVQPPRVPLG